MSIKYFISFSHVVKGMPGYGNVCFAMDYPIKPTDIESLQDYIAEQTGYDKLVILFYKEMNYETGNEKRPNEQKVKKKYFKQAVSKIDALYQKWGNK